MVLELTFVILKPHVLKVPFVSKRSHDSELVKASAVKQPIYPFCTEILHKLPPGVKQLDETTFKRAVRKLLCDKAYYNEIKDIILKNGFLIIRSKEKTLSPIDLQRFYGEHEKKFFYNRLISFMSSGPIEALILARENAILKWRELMGPTRVFEAQFSAPDTIRGKYGLTDTRNATHGSDSTESAQREMSILFPDFDPVLWLKVNESHFKAEGEQISGKDFHSVIK